MQSKEQYLNLYRECRSLIGRHSAPVMNVLRDEAHDELLRMGFPTRKDEEYKYTDVEAIFAPDYVHVLYNGRIIHSGDKSLALKLEEEGYDWLINQYKE